MVVSRRDALIIKEMPAMKVKEEAATGPYLFIGAGSGAEKERVEAVLANRTDRRVRIPYCCGPLRRDGALRYDGKVQYLCNRK